MRRLCVFLQRLRRRCLSLIQLKIKPKGGRDRVSRSRMEKFRRRSCARSPALDDRMLLACNPCSGSRDMVVENYSFQIHGSTGVKPKPKSKSSSGSTELWRNERSWRIVSRVGDKFVTKKVVLKKQMKNTTTKDEDPEKYRLSTSSSCGTSGENQNLMCSWDRELSFASGRSSFDQFDRLEASTKDGFLEPVSPMIHKTRINKHFPTPDSSEDEDEPPTLAELYSSELRGVPVVKDSSDPYNDYRESMLEMSAANGLQKLSEFQELLRCYLRLNPPEFHPTIVKAFTDLLIQRLLF